MDLWSPRLYAFVYLTSKSCPRFVHLEGRLLVRFLTQLKRQKFHTAQRQRGIHQLYTAVQKPEQVW